jgi:uncharacterized protein
MNELFGAGLPTPRPTVVDPATSPYWEAAAEGRLVLPWCRVCDRAFWYPRGFCPRCGGEELDWRDASGAATVHSWTVVRRAGGAWAEVLPFVLAYVALEEGVVVAANLVDVASDDLAVDLRVRPVFEQAAADDLPVLRFAPVTV